MRTLLYISLIAALLFSACRTVIKPSGNVTKQDRKLSGFNSIDVSNSFNVYIQSNGESVEVEADDNLYEYIVIEKQGDCLIIKLKEGIAVADDATLNVYVSAKQLNELKASGACSYIVKDTLNAEKLNIELSGASSLTASVKCGGLTTDLSGASDLDLSGETGLLEVDASGASSVSGSGLTVKNLKADASGASKIDVTVSESLEVVASGASTVNYKGSGKVKSQDISGASELTNK